jgi:hypothetical protein
MNTVSVISKISKFVSIQVCLFFFVFLSAESFSAITITGLTTKTVYANTVTFTISAAAGYDITALLNGSPVAVGLAVTVNSPEYYELSVTKRSQSTGTTESVLIQFIVRDSARADTEWGLPTHTPYPMIDSAAGEFAGGTLNIITPAAYPMGLEIPVIAWVKDGTAKRMGVNGRVTADGFENYPLTLFRGVGSVFLPAATTAGTISYPAQIQSLSTPKQIAIEAATTWQTVSGTISSSVDWGQNARVKVTNTLTVAAGATLTIGAGSVIVVAAGVDIAVTGTITVNGTVQEPVVFTSQNRTAPWGGFLFQASASTGNFNGAIFTASGADASWFANHASSDFVHKPQQCLFYMSNGAHVTATDCSMIENAGQLGHGETSYLTLVRCLVQKMITGGQYNSGGLNVQDSAAIEVPYAGAPFVDDDNDAFYINGGPHSFTNTLIGWTLDDGVDAGEGTKGAVTFTNCWFESCIHEGLAISSGYPRDARAINTVVINCGQGLESGYGQANIDADNCLVTGNVIGARYGDNYNRTYTGFLDVKNSLLLFNVRDVWGMAWDNWQWHSSLMDIQNNYLSVLTDKHPNNQLWNPQGDPNQLNLLTPFMTTASSVVGVGLAVTSNELATSQLKTTNSVPVRLSTFTTNTVSVDYSVVTDTGTLGSGTLTFIPGQTVRKIEFTVPSPATLKRLRVTLSNPVGAELTRYSQVLYQKPYVLEQSLVVKGDTWDYFKGTSEPPADWNQIAFTPALPWLTGPSGFGYERGTGYGSCIATNLSDMYGNYLSVYARKMFWIDDPQRVSSLVLGMLWDDGYIAYINGTRVSSQNPPTIVAYDQPASSTTHESACGVGVLPEQFNLSSDIDHLVPGWNVLAIQVHNAPSTSSDFLFVPSLSCVIQPIPGDTEPDGDIDLADFNVFSGAWLSQDGQAAYVAVCDIDSSKDGVIDILDLAIFVQSWLAGF